MCVPLLTKHLRSRGYRLLVAADLEDAREWMGGEVLIPADLVLINLMRKMPEEIVRLGRELREHSRYDGHTPLVVLPEKFPAELQGRDEKVGKNDWICYFDDDSEQLVALLAHLLDKTPA